MHFVLWFKTLENSVLSQHCFPRSSPHLAVGMCYFGNYIRWSRGIIPTSYNGAWMRGKGLCPELYIY